MVGILFSSLFHWYYIHGSRTYIAHKKHWVSGNVKCSKTTSFRGHENK